MVGLLKDTCFALECDGWLKCGRDKVREGNGRDKESRLAFRGFRVRGVMMRECR